MSAASTSLSPSSMRDTLQRPARELREVLEPLAAQTSPITVHFHHPRTKNELLACIDGILAQSLTENRVPMLHFEAHGAALFPGERTSRGFVLESRELLTWRELFPI